METRVDLQKALHNMKVGDILDVPLDAIKKGRYHPHSWNPMTSFRNFMSTQSRRRVRSRLVPSYYCCRKQESVMRVYCVTSGTEHQVPAAQPPGQPKKYHFDTASPGTEFWFPCGIRDHPRKRRNLYSAAFNQGVRVSIRSIRAPEPGLKVWVLGPRDKPRSSLPKFPDRLPEGHPFRQARAGHQTFVPVEWHEDRHVARQRSKDLMRELSKDVKLVPPDIRVEMWEHPFTLRPWEETGPLPRDETPGVVIHFTSKACDEPPPEIDDLLE